MQRDIEDLGNEDLEEFEEEELTAELCGAPRMPHKLNKKGREFIVDLIDRLRREDASKVANIQDSERHHHREHSLRRELLFRRPSNNPRSMLRRKEKGAVRNASWS